MENKKDNNVSVFQEKWPFTPSTSALLQVLDQIEDLVFIKNDKYQLIWANKTFCEYYGLSREELLGVYASMQEPPDMTAQYVLDDVQVFRTGVPLITEEPIMRHDGEIEMFETYKFPIYEEGLRVKMIAGISRVNPEKNQKKAS